MYDFVKPFIELDPYRNISKCMRFKKTFDIMMIISYSLQNKNKCFTYLYKIMHSLEVYTVINFGIQLIVPEGSFHDGICVTHCDAYLAVYTLTKLTTNILFYIFAIVLIIMLPFMLIYAIYKWCVKFYNRRRMVRVIAQEQ
jgi:hypothetical protein